VIAAACCLPLVACAHSTPGDLASIRARVSSLPDPAGWVREGGVRYDCESINLDCSNTSSGLRLRTTASLTDACATAVAWVTGTQDFLDPTAVVRLTTSTTPTTADCTAEMKARGRYLVTAGAPSTGSTSSSLGWQVLMTSDTSGPRLSAILGDPPERLGGMGA